MAEDSKFKLTADPDETIPSEKESIRLEHPRLLMTYDDVLNGLVDKPKAVRPDLLPLLDTYFTIGEILEYFCFQEGAAKDPALNYQLDPFYFQQKALEMYQAVNSTAVQSGPLKIESLDQTMEAITFNEASLSLMKPLIGPYQGQTTTVGPYTVSKPIATVSSAPNKPLEINLDRFNNIAQPFGLGSIVKAPSYPGYQFRVLDKQRCSHASCGFQEIRVTLISGQAQTWDDTIWDPMSMFFPVEEQVKRILTDGRYPHTCHFCGSPAYIGFTSMDCKSKCQGLKKT